MNSTRHRTTAMQMDQLMEIVNSDTNKNNFIERQKNNVIDLLNEEITKAAKNSKSSCTCTVRVTEIKNRFSIEDMASFILENYSHFTVSFDYSAVRDNISNNIIINISWEKQVEQYTNQSESIRKGRQRSSQGS